MSAENTNLAAAAALMAAEEENNLKEHINNQIKTLGNAMKDDVFEIRSILYNRKNYTIGALVAYDSNVRDLVREAGGNLRAFDEVIAIAGQAIVAESNKSNPIAQKLFKAVSELYQNGNYR